MEVIVKYKQVIIEDDFNKIIKRYEIASIDDRFLPLEAETLNFEDENIKRLLDEILEVVAQQLDIDPEDIYYINDKSGQSIIEC